MIVCMYEDRPDALDGVKLAVITLARYEPDLPVFLVSPGATPTLREWLSQYPQVELRDEPIAESGWDVKPVLLHRRLEDGHRSVLWMDSDILLTDRFPRILHEADARTCIVAQEFYWGELRSGRRLAQVSEEWNRGATSARGGAGLATRTTAWGLRPGRPLPGAVNSGIIRVTKEHLPLLDEWQSLLRDPLYRRAQAAPWYERPPHLMGDQDVLSALLGSAEFAIPVELLRRGVEIAQCGGPSGYMPMERLRTLTRRGRVPPLVHSMVGRPWEPRIDASAGSLEVRLAAYKQALHFELSPYAAIAREYADALGSPPWLTVRTRTGRMLTRLFRDDPVLQGLPLAVVDSLMLRARHSLQRTPLDQRMEAG